MLFPGKVTKILMNFTWWLLFIIIRGCRVQLHSLKKTGRFDAHSTVNKLAATCVSESYLELFPVGIHMFKVNNRNTRARCVICSKLTIKTPEQCQRCQWRIAQNYVETVPFFKISKPGNQVKLQYFCSGIFLNTSRELDRLYQGDLLFKLKYLNLSGINNCLIKSFHRY